MTTKVIDETGVSIGIGDRNGIIVTVQDDETCLSCTLTKAHAERLSRLLLIAIDSLPKDE